MNVLELLTVGEWMFAASVILVAFIVRGMAGFGSGLIAIPLLAISLPLTLVVPILSVLDLFGASAHGIGQRTQIAWREIQRIGLPSILGIALGYFVFTSSELDVLKAGLGIFVFSYGVYVLWGHQFKSNKPQLWAGPLGLAGGFIGTLYGTGGPFYVIYLNMRGLDKSSFRATVATIFIFESSLRLIVYWFGGLLNEQHLILLMLALPIMIGGMYWGEKVHVNVSSKTFTKAIALLLLISGVALYFG